MTREAHPAAVRAAHAPARRRAALAAAAIGVLITGLAVSRGTGLAADLAGGALYAALVQLLVLLVAPRTRPLVAGAVALGLCTAVELAQLTGLPATAVDAWPPLHYVLGSTFSAPDLPAYAAGAAAVTWFDASRAGR